MHLLFYLVLSSGLRNSPLLYSYPRTTSSTGGSLDAREPAVSILQLRHTLAFDPDQIPLQWKSACHTTAIGILNICSQILNPACATPDLHLYCRQGASATAFEISQAQSSLRGFEDGCNALGITVASLTIDPKAASTVTATGTSPTGKATSSLTGTTAAPSGTGSSSSTSGATSNGLRKLSIVSLLIACGSVFYVF
ncbi:hypothetical protein ABKN59_004582 [Abortiporus biennis]